MAEKDKSNGLFSKNPSKDQIISRLVQIRDYIVKAEETLNDMAPYLQDDPKVFQLHDMISELRDTEKRLLEMLRDFDREWSPLNATLEARMSPPQPFPNNLNSTTVDEALQDFAMIEALESERSYLLDLGQKLSGRDKGSSVCSPGQKRLVSSELEMDNKVGKILGEINSIEARRCQSAADGQQIALEELQEDEMCCRDLSELQGKRFEIHKIMSEIALLRRAKDESTRKIDLLQQALSGNSSNTDIRRPEYLTTPWSSDSKEELSKTVQPPTLRDNHNDSSTSVADTEWNETFYRTFNGKLLEIQTMREKLEALQTLVHSIPAPPSSSNYQFSDNSSIFVDRYMAETTSVLKHLVSTVTQISSGLASQKHQLSVLNNNMSKLTERVELLILRFSNDVRQFSTNHTERNSVSVQNPSRPRSNRSFNCTALNNDVSENSYDIGFPFYDQPYKQDKRSELKSVYPGSSAGIRELWTGSHVTPASSSGHPSEHPRFNHENFEHSASSSTHSTQIPSGSPSLWTSANNQDQFLLKRPWVSPSSLGRTALNNQVPPGNRTNRDNRYWDNFRSQSRQNVLSASNKSNEALSNSVMQGNTETNNQVPYLTNNIRRRDFRSDKNPGEVKPIWMNHFVENIASNKKRNQEQQVLPQRSVSTASNNFGSNFTSDEITSPTEKCLTEMCQKLSQMKNDCIRTRTISAVRKMVEQSIRQDELKESSGIQSQSTNIPLSDLNEQLAAACSGISETNNANDLFGQIGNATNNNDPLRTSNFNRDRDLIRRPDQTFVPSIIASFHAAQKSIAEAQTNSPLLDSPTSSSRVGLRETVLPTERKFPDSTSLSPSISVCKGESYFDYECDLENGNETVSTPMRDFTVGESSLDSNNQQKFAACLLPMSESLTSESLKGSNNSNCKEQLMTSTPWLDNEEVNDTMSSYPTNSSAGRGEPGASHVMSNPVEQCASTSSDTNQISPEVETVGSIRHHF